MRSYSITLFLLLSVSSFAQKTDSAFHNSLPRHTIKFGPLHLLNFYSTVQVAYEYRFRKNHSAQFDIGYVFDSRVENVRFKDRRGVKIKLDYRYYFPGLISTTEAYYLAAEAYTNLIDFDRETTQTECFDIDCMNQYQRTYFFKVKYREKGFVLRYGANYFIDKFVLDFNVGLVLRMVDYQKPDIVDGIDTFDGGSFDFDLINEDKRTVLRPTATVRIGYRIK